MIHLMSKDDIEDPELCGYAGPGWYFWDETDANLIGPYKTPEDTEAGLKKYAEYLDDKVPSELKS